VQSAFNGISEHFLGDRLSNDSPYAMRPLSVLCVSDIVYCGQTVGWIKMKLGVEVGLGPGHIVLDGTKFLVPKGAQPRSFRPMSVVAKWLDRLRCHLVWS